MQNLKVLYCSGNLLKSLNVPIDITFSKPQFFFKNLPVKQNSEESQQF